MKVIYCACGNDLKCGGSCREQNLLRKRSGDLKHCPASYEKTPKSKGYTVRNDR